MADVSTSYATVSTDAPSYYIARRMYELAERNLVLGRYATRYELPQRMGTTLRAVRIGRLTLPRTPLTEGTAPDAIALAITNKDVTVQQWGIVVLLTDVAELTTVHPMLTAAIERTALAMSEMFEREMAQTLLTGTNVTYANANSTRTSVSSTVTSTILSTGEIIGLTTTLRRRGAIPIKGPLYGGVIPPQMEADIMAEPNFQAAIARGQDLERLDFAKIGPWMGVDWVRSNFLPFLRGIASPQSGAAGDVSAQVSFGSVGTGSYITSATASTVDVVVVGRDINSGYERLITVQQQLAVTGATGITVHTPTNAGYVYDIYTPTLNTGATPRLYSTNVAADTNVLVTALASASAKAPPAAPTNGQNVFVGWVFGRDAFGRVELNGMSMRTYLTPAGASFSNPLAQGRKIGAKVMWNSWILDDNFFQRFEANSAYPSGLP